MLTDNGYRSIETLRIGDRVFTHNGNWKPISAVGRKQSKTVIMKGNHYGVIATPNHPFYSAEQLKRWNGDGYVRTLDKLGEWLPAEKMAGRRWAVPNTFSGINIPAIERLNGKQNVPPKIDENLMYVVGRWLADGWVRDGQRSGRPIGQTFGQIFICANDEKSDYLEIRLHNVFDGNASIVKTRERTVNKFSISSQALCKWIKNNFGKMADGKTLPAWAFCMNQNMRAALLRGYLDGDGYHFKENIWKVTTISKALAHSVRLLGDSLGYSCSVYYANVGDTAVIEGRIVNQKPQYQVSLNNEKRKTSVVIGSHNWYQCKSVEPFSEEQTVYNITVDDDHSYVVEGFIVHNCQDLSIAGKRAGLKHESNGDEETTRSGLFMESIRIIKEMRIATNNEYPKFAVWENVPGAFSSNKGEDFRIVIEELCRCADETASIPQPPKEKWSTAGGVVGDGYSLAWRVMDAKYFGVPQRRRRIIAVLDLTGERAGEILFKPDSVCRNSEKSRVEGETASYDLEASVRANDCEHSMRAFSFDSLASNSMKSRNPNSGCREVDIAKCLDTTDPNPSKNQGGIAIVETLAFNTTQITSPTNGNNPKWNDPCHCLASTDHPPAVVIDNRGIYDMTHACDVIRDCGQICPNLQARMGTGGNQVPLTVEPLERERERVICATTGSFMTVAMDVCPNLMARDYKDPNTITVKVASDNMSKMRSEH